MILRAELRDITTLDVDAIVNAANEALTSGGGVSGAIHRAAGPELAIACAKVAPCETGEARITPGFALRARYVIHAVGPIWTGGLSREPQLLATAYLSSLKLAARHGLRRIAFPAISTGIYGYPLAAATAIAVETVRSIVEQGGAFKEVIFSCFDADTLAAYRACGVLEDSMPVPPSL